MSSYYDMNDQCYKEFGRSLEFVSSAVEHYEEFLGTDVTESEITISVEGDHWKESPNNTGANAMMKKIRDVNGGSIWMNLKKEIVYVPTINQTDDRPENQKESSEFAKRFTGHRPDEDRIYVQRAIRSSS